MQTYSVETTINREGELHLEHVPFHVGDQLRVILIPQAAIEDKMDEKAWQEFGMREFLKGYSEEDSIYDS
jgi:hypothetical protein